MSYLAASHARTVGGNLTGYGQASEIQYGVLPALVGSAYPPQGNTPSSAVNQGQQASTIRTNSAVVNRAVHKKGIRTLLALGAQAMPTRPVPHPGPDSGQVPGTPSQPYQASVNVGQFNDNLHPSSCYPLNLGLTFKVPRPAPPIPTGMAPKPRWTAVQKVGRASGAPRAYNTQSSNN